jgi:hypothetical protein
MSDGSHALQLYGTVGGCWAALAYHPIPLSGPLDVKVKVRNGDNTLTGCHPDRADIGLREGTSWANPERRLMSFLGNGTITSGNGLVLGSYNAGQWYEAEIRYEPQGSQVRLTYLIDGSMRESETVPVSSSESSLTNLEIGSQEGTAWFASITITALESG